MTSLLSLSQAMLVALAVQTGPQSGAQPPAERPQAASTARTPRAAEGWTWTLYSGDGPLVLANEIPDTPRLRTTLECAPGSSIVRLAFHDAPGADGFATIRSGAASAEVEARARRGRLEAAVRADHPVFAAFLASGRLTLTLGDQSQTVEIDRANLSKLRRFAELCTG
ncbi:hypothetical protein [Brevundimonas guildfordensis]|uniref:Uncharacterized protein n=1 Tax=Brevundimonas guildfordensis TaxID=2762241 RepID=A0ABR8R2A0_9CAUL|nr:hypothetical protein [Brevundimonas guildfordensis]MBD7941919.1 hypothetical protein [Brevundimonas guildfordensis]